MAVGSPERMLPALRDPKRPPEPPTGLRSHLSDDPSGLAEVVDERVGSRIVTIRAADSGGRRSSANILVHKMYAMRGYTTSIGAQGAPNLVTLIATDHEETIGTISVRFDSPEGLRSEELFPDEIRALRDQGRHLCEFTKLAMDHVVKSKRVLASLFHTAYIWAHRILDFDDVVIEVNPRHVLYYRKKLGFAVIGPQRMNRRVNAPAVLMRLDFAQARRHVERWAGSAEQNPQERSLYPYFFSPQEEAGLIARLPKSPP